MKLVNCITINTDASHSSLKNVGGYAFYIVCDHFKIQKSGMFRGYVKDSFDAEVMCIANAIHTLLSQPELPMSKHIIINSDRLDSFPYLQPSIKRKNKRQSANKAHDYIEKLINTTRSDVLLRHVKSHNGAKDARSWVNEWCDKEAKKWMKIALKTK